MTRSLWLHVTTSPITPPKPSASKRTLGRSFSTRSTVPSKDEFEQIFQTRGGKPSRRRRNFLLGITVAVVILAFFLLPIFDVETPPSSSGFAAGLFDVSASGSPSYALFGCGLVVTTGTFVHPPVYGEAPGSNRIPEDDFQWICPR
jgi:hypothetical protein